MRTGKNAHTYPTFVGVRKCFLRWEWEPVRDTQSWFPHVRMSVTQSVVPKLTESNCPSQGVFTSRPVVDESPLLRHDYVIPGSSKETAPAHGHDTITHTHTLYGKHDRNPVGALRGRTTPPSLRPNPSRVLPEGFERIPQRIVCGYPCLVGLLLASYRLRQQRRYQCAYELTNKEQVITNSSPTIPA
jgi:hypothetical protein